ncbi:MAG: hypothetical protein AAGF58_12360 [Pseudomonadota bacterium]
MTALVELCVFPERLHPVSAFFLRQFVDGDISAALFLQYFSLPNSTYIDLAQCIVRVTTG